MKHSICPLNSLSLECFSDTVNALVKSRSNLGAELLKNLLYITSSDGAALYLSGEGDFSFELTHQRSIHTYPSSLSPQDIPSLEFALDSGEAIPVHSGKDSHFSELLFHETFQSSLLLPLKKQNSIASLIFLHSHEPSWYKEDIFSFCIHIQKFTQTLLLCEEVIL